MSDDLKNCPFCSGEAKLFGPDAHTIINVRCLSCGTWGPSFVAGHGGTIEEAIAAWNRRALSAKGTEPVARKIFPVLHGGGVTWELVEGHAQQAKRNHSQTVQRLAERGGLSWQELHDVLHDQRYDTCRLDANTAMIECLALDARIRSALEPTAAPAVDDLLDQMAKHSGWQLEKGYHDGDEEGDYGWIVFEVRGNINDREWREIGFGETPRDALTAALTNGAAP